MKISISFDLNHEFEKARKNDEENYESFC